MVTKIRKDILCLNALVKRLEETYYGSAPHEGYFLQVPEQWIFLGEQLLKLKPKRILETGTHLGGFVVFAKLILPNVKIVTFGNRESSGKCVEIINAEFGEDFAVFIQGDTKETLPAYADQFDFAWIDGGHSLEVCGNDLAQCARLKIPILALDDVYGCPGVWPAIGNFLKSGEYHAVDSSADDRGILILERRFG